MENWTLYHNPMCSKSREALRRLQEKGIEPQVIEYLNQPLTEEALRKLISRLTEPPSALVRVREEQYKSKPFDLSSVDEIVRHLALHPRLLERPIVTKGETAVIGRPVEKLDALFETSK